MVAHVEQERYNPTDLITLTVPLSLPYQVDWDRWEQVRGEIEIDGITYQYVQRKVQGGQMVLQCLPNHQQAKIESARDRFFELANSFNDDEPAGKNGHPPLVKLTKPALTDYDDFASCWSLPPGSVGPTIVPSAGSVALVQRAHAMPGQPPELIG